MDSEVLALARALQQWEGQALRARDTLETAVTAATGAERERRRLTEQLEEDTGRLERQLKEWSDGLKCSERRNSGAHAVEGWTVAKVTQGGGGGGRARECQNKEKLLEQRFRSSLRDFRQWLVNANISTAKCFDSPHSIQEASTSLHRIQEFLSDSEQGQTRLNAVISHGDRLGAVVSADKVEAVRSKVNAAKVDWGNLMDNLKQRQTVLQSVLEEMSSMESELGRLRERAHSLWEGQAAGKGFVHRVCQLAARYLALSNRTKEKVSRVERVVGEHQLFSQGLQELQSWVSEALQILETCRTPNADKSVLLTRMSQLEELLAARQEREIQLKMLITRGEAVQRNTSAEGVHVLLYEEVLSHSSLLQTIATKGSNLPEHSSTQQEVQQLSERYEAIKDKAKAAVRKAEELVLVHQEYQRGLHMFEDWLEQEQSHLGLLSPLDGDVNMLEKTLKELHTLQSRCSEGHALLKSALSSRERVIPCGVPQIEDRALETAQREWQAYQDRLEVTRVNLEQTLIRLQQLEGRFQSLDKWLGDIELNVGLRNDRRSDCAAKERQLQQLLALSALAQQVVEDAHVSARVSARVTQLTSRYHVLLLRIQETVRQIQEELKIIGDAQDVLRTFSDWLSRTTAAFKAASDGEQAPDRASLEKKMKRLKALQRNVDEGHTLFKTLREKAQLAVSILDESGACEMEKEVQERRAQLEEVALEIRAEHGGTEKSTMLYKEVQERYKTQLQWLKDTRALLGSSAEPKAELYQRKAQLAKYKVLEQSLLSRASALSAMMEKGKTLLSLLHSPSINQIMEQLQSDYQELCITARTRVQNLEAQVKKQEVYHTELQEVERWLLQMSSRMVTPDPTPGFEERLLGLKERGDELMSGCTERLQTRLRQQIQNHLQGARDSYSAICSTAQRVYQSLDRELQRHISLRDTLQQCQTWLLNIQEELQPSTHPPRYLEEALIQLKQERALQEQASTYLQLICSTCDLTDEKVQETAADIQQVKIQIEERMLESQELADSWREIESLRSDLEARLREAEKFLQNMLRRPADLEPMVSQNQLDQAQDFIQEIQARQADLTSLRESIGRLVPSQDSPELVEIGRLRRSWLELAKQAAELLEQREEDLQRSGDYQESLTVGSFFRGDMESTAGCLDAFRKLSLDLQDQRCVLEDLRDNKNAILPRLSLEDKDLVKEQVGYLEQRWTQMEMQVEQKIQDTIETLEELNHLEDQLREIQEWAEVQRPSLSDLLKTSPPPDLAQSFLFDHLSFCAELEAKQQLINQSMSEADILYAHLGLNEKKRLQTLVQDVQVEVETLASKAAHYRKSLSKVFTEQTQFLQALDRAAGWIKQQEQRVLADEHVALLPDELSKQVSICKNISSSLKAYQVELTSLWTQGRELVKDTTEDEKKETIQRLEELQGTFEASLQRCTHHLQHLEKALVIRKYFKVDLDRICEWLKYAESATFPIMDLNQNDMELQNQLVKYQQILDNTSAYENLLLIVQRAGQEILPTLNEVDHCYLDEKLNGLPQQYNAILLSTKEKRDTIQRVILERRELESLIEATHKALEELQEQCDVLEKQSPGTSVEDGESLHNDYKAIEKSLLNLFHTMNELKSKTQDFYFTGQPYERETIDQLASLYSRLDQSTKEKVKQLNCTLNVLNDFRTTITKMDIGIDAVKEHVDKLNSEKQLDAMERLSKLHMMAKELDEITSYSEGLTEWKVDFSQHFDMLEAQVSIKDTQVQVLKSVVSKFIEECKECVWNKPNFQTELKECLLWFKTVREDLKSHFTLQEISVLVVQDEIRSVVALQREIQSRLQLLKILSQNERKRFETSHQPFPDDMETCLKDIVALESEVVLQSALSSSQFYQSALKSTCKWLKDADAVLKQKNLELELEELTESLKELENILNQESTIRKAINDLEGMLAKMEDFVDSAVVMKLKEGHGTTCQKSAELLEQLRCHQETLNRCLSQWTALCKDREVLMNEMSEVERRLSEFRTAKSSSLQEAEDKLCLHQDVMNQLAACQDKSANLKAQSERPYLKPVSSAAVSRTVCALDQRWTQLSSVAKAQQKTLKDTVHDWRRFIEKLEKMRSVSEDLHSRVPDSVVEKAASTVALHNLLEYHDSFSREVERENSALTLLRHHALHLLLQSETFSNQSSCNQTSRVGRLSTTPFKRPTTPIKRPTTPIKQPTTPLKQPTTSIEQPTTPIKEPTTPIRQPTTSIKQQITSNEPSTTPTTSPATSTTQLTLPITHIATPANHLHNTSKQTDTPISQPATPRNHLESSCRQPTTPVNHQTITPANHLAAPTKQATQEEPSSEDAFCLLEIQAMQEKYESLLQKVCVSRQQVQVELLEREEVERELGLVKDWIQDTQGLLLSPTADLDTLLSDLETAHGGVQSQRQALEQIADRQQMKYKDLHAAVPSEISTQLAQVQSREREVQHSRDLKEDFNARLKDISEKVSVISAKLKQKSVDVEEAKEETEILCEELKDCSHALSELDVAVQDFGEQNPLLARQLGATLSKLTELHSQTSRLAEGKSRRLEKAAQHFQEFNTKLTLILNWTEKAETLVSSSIVWSPASMMQEQIRTHQALLREWRRLQGDTEAVMERVGLLGDVVHTDALHQQDLSRLESEVKSLHRSIERVQEMLASPELARLSLREQLLQRQHLLTEMEGFKVQVQAVQKCMSALQLPEDAMLTLPLCVTAQTSTAFDSVASTAFDSVASTAFDSVAPTAFDSVASTAFSVASTAFDSVASTAFDSVASTAFDSVASTAFDSEAVVQYEQYEQEVTNLQKMIEEAQRVIQDRPVATGNIQELQTQIQHHEELAQKIKGYQEQIAALNSKCKMLTVKAKHATMLLTVSEVGGLSDGLEELEEEEEEMTKHPTTHPSVVMMTAGRCHTLLSPVTEESGEEGTNSEVSSPPACRSPSPGPNADVSLNQVSGRAPLSRAPLQELYDPSLDSAATANLDDLQRSWETLKNVISEKQKSLYEALERQQHYQESLQSISTKMESIEASLNEGLEPGKSPESQMAAHQALMDEILMLQDEISALQACFSEELQQDEESPEQDAGDQLALHSTLTVLGERMATIRMKASGKRQLLEERLNEQLEEQRQEQALQRYHSEAEELDHWLLSTRATLNSALQPHPEDMDMEEQLIDCQNMLMEIEQKVLCLSELSVHSESLLLEGKVGTRGDAEQLTHKLHSLKASLLELQRILQDKHTHIQGSLMEQEESEPDSTMSQSPSVLDWLSQARSTRSQQNQDTVQRQRELEAQLEEQRKLMQSVASRGEELLSHSQTTPNGDSAADLEDVSDPGESGKEQDGMKIKWENLSKDLNTKLQLLLNTMQDEQLSSVYQRSRVSSPGSVFRGDRLTPDVLSPSTLFENFNQKLEEPPEAHTRENILYDAVSSASTWLDGAENTLLSGPVLLSDDSETQLCHLEGLNKEVKNISEEMCKCREVLEGRDEGGDELIEEVLDGLDERLRLMDSLLEQRCDGIRDKLQEHTTFQVELRNLFAAMNNWKHQLLQKMCGAADRPVSKQLETLVLKTQYEKALQDLQELVDTAQDKMAADQKTTAGSALEVQILLDKHKEFFQGLEAHVVLTQAFFRQEWSRFVRDYQALYKQLEVVESSIPSMGLVEETEERLSERIALYQCLKSTLVERQQQLYQVLEDGKRLLLRVCCSELEVQLTQLGERWLSSTTKISKELQRLDSTLKHWSRYQSDSAELGQWLSSALSRLEFWSTQSVTVPQELEMVRDHLHAFLEFSKEVDAKSSLRSSVLSRGNQLLRLKKVDTAALRTHLGQVETQWAELLTRIPVVQEKLHQLQMEKLASRHAITELMSWISLMENIIQEDQNKILEAVGSEVGFGIDLSCKQLTVDFVNQSVLQISSQDVEGKRSDKTDFAERLGAMNRRWQILQGLIMEKELEELVKDKEKDLEKVEEKGCSLIQGKKGDASAVVMETLKGLNQAWTKLDQLIHGYLMEGQYSISRLRLLTGSPDAVLVQVENLESLQEELEKQESSVKKFGSLTEQLLKDCHCTVADSLNTTLTEINHRWDSLLEQISDQLKSSKNLLQLWQRYKELHESSGKDVQRLEERAERLLHSSAHRNTTEQEVTAWIHDCDQLTSVEEQLRLQVEPSSMATIHTDYLSLTRRLATVGHALHRQQALIEVASVKDYQSFREEVRCLSRCLGEAQEVLNDSDPVASADLASVQERMEKLNRQSFLEKCETWLSFLNQTEEKLGAEISGNYASLLEQQREHEVPFE
ncbi:Nesprin-1 [Bagarius yarrelli]|uniref:Nesprin-1 n=1 Tax=Bagarius yarrelli TaxID=175774 RepID=A0A556V228_BAGYA|nr:Nesprin-1 [Bagarius yarrelli]